MGGCSQVECETCPYYDKMYDRCTLEEDDTLPLDELFERNNGDKNSNDL